MNKLVPWYNANMGQIVKLGRYMVVVSKRCTHNQYGSWERGFKFSDNEYGLLKRETRSLNGERFKQLRMVYSMDHGTTWHLTVKDAARSRGKIKLNSNKSQEFAFNSIQEINRRYDGPGYTWRP